MIIVKLSSGIGNQLFMLCFYEYIKQQTNQNVYFDLSSFNFDSSNRKVEIELLYPKLPMNHNLRWLYNGKNKWMRKGFDFLFRKISSVKIINEHNFNPEERYSPGLNYYFLGYWQTTKYVQLLANVENIFIPKESAPEIVEEYLSRIKVSDISVSMHVRRGDYFSNKKYVNRYGVCTEQYYRNAISYCYDCIGAFDLFVFSDDVSWVKNNIQFLKGINVIFVPNEPVNSYWYIHLMSFCTHNIISNSTFSWWGAYLNKNTSKLVITPNIWRFDSEENLSLPEWTKISI